MNYIHSDQQGRASAKAGDTLGDAQAAEQGVWADEKTNPGSTKQNGRGQPRPGYVVR